MASVSVGRTSSPSTGDKLLACIAEQGSAAHPWSSSPDLLRGPDAWRNLADAVHLLCMLHGRHPGVVDHAANRAIDAPVRAWYARATAGFAAERALLTRLAVAAGPMPGTPGAADSEAAAMAQRNALALLAQSERNGCALGASLALCLDWIAVREVLNAASQRFGVEPPPPPGLGSGVRDLADAAPSPSVERAILFGAEQLAVQHFGLWDLLEARAEARSAT